MKRLPDSELEIIRFYKENGFEFAVYDDSHHFVLNFQDDVEL